jgi:subtilisin family serine protease
MHRSKFFTTLSVLAALGGAGAASAAPAAPNRLLVVFKSESLSAQNDALIAKAGGKVAKKLPALGVVTVLGDAKVRAKLERDPSVLAVSAERFHALPRTSVQRAPETQATTAAPAPQDNLWWYLWGVRRVNAPAAWGQVSLEQQAAVTVAVLDSGVAHDHPDLAGQVSYFKATNYCPETGGVPARASYPVYGTLIDFDATPDWDPAVNGCTPAPAYYNGHGTHVAGTVAAKVAGGRVVGVAPGARIAAYKVFDRYRFTDADGTVVDDIGAFDGATFAAITDAADQGFQVISMSLGGTADHGNKDDIAGIHAWDRVVKYATKKGSVVIASAGNEAENSNGRVMHLPSDLPLVMSTSASNTNQLAVDAAGNLFAVPGSDTLASYSNYGASTDIAAPGGDCLTATCDSAVDGFYFIASSYIWEDGELGYALNAGTSMATPHVSGVAALVRAKFPQLGVSEVRTRLQSTAQQVGSRQAFGHGVVDAAAATR